MFSRSWFGCVLALAVVGCGAPVINQANLKIVSDGRSILFDREFRYDISKENDHPRPKPGQFRGLLRGAYTARYEDAEGVYYANDNACVIYSADLDQKLKFVSTGGVWISKSTVGPAFRLYWVSGKPGPIPTAIDPEPHCGEVTLPSASAISTASLDPAVTTQIVRATAPQAAPAAAGTGAGLAAGVIGAIAEYERGKIVLLPAPVAGTSITGAFRVELR